MRDKKGQEIYHNSDIFKLVHTHNRNKDLLKHARHGHFSTVRETMQSKNKVGVTFSQSVNCTLTTRPSQYKSSFLCAALLHGFVCYKPLGSTPLSNTKQYTHHTNLPIQLQVSVYCFFFFFT